MNTPSLAQDVDSIQQRLTTYACGLHYDSVTPEAIHAAKVRLIDTLGALMGGFCAKSSRIARGLAARLPDPNGATVIGTRIKTTPDMAAFVNGTTAPYAELTDVYHWPGSFGGHPSDVIAPVLAAAEHASAPGRELITAIVLAYEISLRINDLFHNPGFDHSNFCCLAGAIASGKLFHLSANQLSQCISLAIIPNNALKTDRTSSMSMWKVAATGQGGRAAVFSALLARAGLEGPHLPFEGQAGWCDHVMLKRFSLDKMGGEGTAFKILDTSIKMRPVSANCISLILAGEKIAPLETVADVVDITAEVYGKVKNMSASEAGGRAPDSKENADSHPAFLLATTLIEGAVTLNSFDAAHLGNPAVHALMRKIKFVENDAFTREFAHVPVKQRTRLTVRMRNGQQLVSESGDGPDDLSTPKTDLQIEEKFRRLTEDLLGSQRVTAILDRLWNLDDARDVAAIPADFVLD